MRTYSGTVSFFAGALITFFTLSQLSFSGNNGAAKPDEALYQWRPPALPDSLSFAGEKVPLERWDVKERLDREMLYNAYNQATVIYLLKLSNRYFPIISERLKANGVPDDFKYLCVAESNLVSSAVSHAGAVGFWQFMKTTGAGYNLEMNSNVDERYHIEKATDAACSYLKRAYAKFGNWTAAAASYNCGQGGYNGQATFQHTNYYYDLYLPEETNRYIYRILTFKQLLENAEQYGYLVKDEDKYGEVPYRTIAVKNTIPDLAQFAMDNGTTYKILRLMNPWLRGRSLTVRPGDSYTINLPQ